jgi:PleD family two-component response regulator
MVTVFPLLAMKKRLSPNCCRNKTGYEVILILKLIMIKMESEEFNLFIVDDDKASAIALKEYLSNTFQDRLKICTFFDGESCLKNINEKTDVVILDYFFSNKNGNEILRAIKERNPRTEVIMLSGNEDLETALESFKLGAKNYILKGKTAWRKISKLVRSILGLPIISIKEYGVARFVSILLFAFLSMGAAISLFIKLIT